MAGRHTARHLRTGNRHAWPATTAGHVRWFSGAGAWPQALPAGPSPQTASAGPRARSAHAGPAAVAGPWPERAVAAARFASLVYVFVVVLLVLAAVIPAVVAGFQPLSVVSGSMQPAIKPGAMVLVQPTEPDRFYAAPSILAFHDAARADRLVTHRVVDTRMADDGVVRYTTRGDANRVPDSGAVAHDQVVGAVRMVVPYVGLPQTWLHHGELAKVALLMLVSLLAVGALLVRTRP